MDRRTLLAVMLCFLIFFGWQKLYIEPRLPKEQPTTSVTSGANTSTAGAPSTQVTTGGSATSAAAPADQQKRPPETRALTTPTGEAVIGDDGKVFVGWKLKGYHSGLSTETAAIDLSTVTNQASEVDLAFDDPSLGYLNTVQGAFASSAQGIIWNYEDANVKMSRETVASASGPYVDLKINVEFKNKQPNYAFLSLTGQKLAEKDPEEQDRQLVYWANQSLERVHLNDTVELKQIPTAVGYIGATNRYFVMTLVNQSSVEPKGLLQPLPNGAGRISMVYPVTGNSIQIPVKVYFGPKDLQLLRAVDPRLDHVVDFGWFTIFAYPLLKILKWLYQFVGNYGVAIILLTILLKIVTYPLTYKSMKSMKEMARIQPQLQALREKYADNKEALNREMLVLMRSHGYNPMAGCLPILIQMPVFFALYRVLYSSIELYHAPFAAWIKDLSFHDPYYVTPILLSLTMFIQQKLTPNTATDPMQARMMQLMPLIFGAFMLTLPSGLTLYMLTNALASILQQLILNKKLNTGHVQAVPARAR